MMMRLRVAFGLAVLTVVGCGGGNDVATDHPYTPEDNVGKVDTSLPPDLQARQRAIKQILDGLMNMETDFEHFENYTPNIRFTESEESFGVMYGWKFNGKPSGTDVPVTIFLGEDDEMKPTDPSDRVYSVTGNGTYTITRKK